MCVFIVRKIIFHMAIKTIIRTIFGNIYLLETIESPSPLLWTSTVILFVPLIINKENSCLMSTTAICKKLKPFIYNLKNFISLPEQNSPPWNLPDQLFRHLCENSTNQHRSFSIRVNKFTWIESFLFICLILLDFFIFLWFSMFTCLKLRDFYWLYFIITYLNRFRRISSFPKSVFDR